MMKKSNTLWLMLLLVSTIVSISSCKKDPIVVESNAVKVSDNATHGKILTDPEGMSLYLFSKDTKGTSLCIDGCLDNWSVFYKETITVDAGLDVADFATITRTDGVKQTTYKGWPLLFWSGCRPWR